MDAMQSHSKCILCRSILMLCRVMLSDDMQGHSKWMLCRVILNACYAESF